METSAISEQIGDRIREARDEIGLSLTELSNEIDSSPSTIRRWEAGEVSISILNLLKLSRVLEKPVCFFLQDVAEDQWRAQWLSKWVKAEENGDQAEMGVCLKDLVEVAPRCEIYIQVGAS